MNYAYVDKATGIVLNTIVADSNYQVPEDKLLILIPEGIMCNIGWFWDGASFIDPNPPIADSSTPEVII